MNLFAVKPIDRILAESNEAEHSLKRTLGAGSLVALGIGAVVGAGIFSLSGEVAANNAGPAILLSFVVAAIGCAFAGLCYSEFATMIPIAGSAYTYSYATMGEFVAWIIGWTLTLEYAVGAATVSVSWSSHVYYLLERFGIGFPPSLAISPFDTIQLPNGSVVHGIVNLPAVFAICLISLVLIRGISESAVVNNIIVVLKVTVVLVFVGIGWSYIHPANLTPFIPPNTGGTFSGHFGWFGILRGAGIIFFAYIGFDAVSTAAQETKNPQRNMPIGIIGSLAICTVLFILYAYTLTGIVPYKQLHSAAPITLALAKMPYPWLGVAMDLAVIAGLTSVMLVMLLGQSRVFYSMSRDGLLPKLFSDIHHKFRTPWRSNLLLMTAVAFVSAFTPIATLGEMTSIGTLTAFILVCAGIIIMRKKRPELPRPFKTPWVPLVPILGILFNLLLMVSLSPFTWMLFIVWFAIGLAVFFLYSRYHSKLTAVGATTSRPAPSLGD